VLSINDIEENQFWRSFVRSLSGAFACQKRFLLIQSDKHNECRMHETIHHHHHHHRRRHHHPHQ
jgi:hypothetical protein